MINRPFFDFEFDDFLTKLYRNNKRQVCKYFLWFNEVTKTKTKVYLTMKTTRTLSKCNYGIIK